MTGEYPLAFHEINSDLSGREKQIKDNPNPIIFLLDRVENSRNLGAIFRLADAGRIAGIYGYKSKFPSNDTIIKRISRQTSSHIPFTVLNNLKEVIDLSKKYRPIALEYTNKSIPYNSYLSNEPCMLIIGNEQKGVSKDLLEISESSLHIPMLGMNSSMNVSVATGICLYHMLANIEKL